MNFQNLQYFLIVTEEMNVTRAAKRLHISEQALSRQIGKLEKELGAKLFERYPRFTLSPAGKRLKAAAEQIGGTAHHPAHRRATADIVLVLNLADRRKIPHPVRIHLPPTPPPGGIVEKPRLSPVGYHV